MMNTGDYFGLLRKRWRSIAAVALLVLAAVSALTLVMTPSYSATARVFFGVQTGESVTDLSQGSTFTENQMSSYAEVAKSPLVLDRVINSLDLPVSGSDLTSRINASVPSGTVILDITATDGNPRRAAAIANEIATQLGRVAAALSPARPDGSEAVKATTLAVALVPTSPSAPNLALNLALGLVVGLLVGVGVALARQTLDSKVRNESDLRAVTDVPLLGTLPYDQRATDHPAVIIDEPQGALSEAVRRLRTNLQFVDIASGSRSIVMTSSVPGEGKSLTSLNLAIGAAEAGMRAVLVDADLRRPSLASYLGIEGAVGLTTVLIGRTGFREVIQPFGGTGLDILPAGQIPPNPSELLGSPAMSKLLDELSTIYDIIIMDSPPLLPVTDAAVLSRVAEGTLVVVGADRIHRPQLQEALDSLGTVKANLLGVVLNKVARRDGAGYGYGAYRTYEGGADSLSGTPTTQRPVEVTTRQSDDCDDRSLSARGRP
jgi:polysaccharide biosynthesis transport protein